MSGGEALWETVDGSDPFCHHPELRRLMTHPENSFFREIDFAELDRSMADVGRPADWRYSDEVREKMLQDSLAPRLGRDLWVFAYGSLMWDPGFYFEEVRRARVEGLQRRFILRVEGGRGTVENPSVMAALDNGPFCDGIVFRIAAERLAREYRSIWQRERISPAYCDRMVTAQTAQGPVEALAFVADHSSDKIVPDMSRADQLKALATASGILGTNIAYIDNLKEHFHTLGIADAEVDSLHKDAHALRESLNLAP